MNDRKEFILKQIEKLSLLLFEKKVGLTFVTYVFFLLFILYFKEEIIVFSSMNFYFDLILVEINWINSSIFFLLLGFTGFIYVFVFPGVIILIKQGHSITVENLIIGSTIGIALMILGSLYLQLFLLPLNKIMILLLPVFIATVGLFIPKGAFPHPLTDIKIEKTRFILPVIVICSLICILIILIRLGGFCYQIYPYSNSKGYAEMIRRIVNGTYFFNEAFGSWPPLYLILSTLIYPFVGNEFISLKVVSFLFSIIIPFVGTIIFVNLNSNIKTKDWQLPIVFMLFMAFPWSTVLSAVALEDSTLAFTFLTAVLYITLAIKKDFNGSFLFLGAVFLFSCFLLRYSSALLVIITTISMFLLFMIRKKQISWVIMKKTVFYALGGIFTVFPWFFRNLILFGQFLRIGSFDLFALSNLSSQYPIIIITDIFYDRLFHLYWGFLGWQIILYCSIILLYSAWRRSIDLSLYLLIIITIPTGLLSLFYIPSLQERFWMPILIVIPLFIALGTNHKVFIGPLIALIAFYIPISSRELEYYWFVEFSATIYPEGWNLPIFKEFTISIIDPIFLFFCFLYIIFMIYLLFFVKNLDVDFYSLIKSSELDLKKLDIQLWQKIFLSFMVVLTFSIATRPILVTVNNFFYNAAIIMELITSISPIALYLIPGTFGFIYLFFLPGYVFLIRQKWPETSPLTLTCSIGIGILLTSLWLFFLQLFFIPINYFVVLLSSMIVLIMVSLAPKNLFLVPQVQISRTSARIPVLIAGIFVSTVTFLMRLGSFSIQVYSYSDSTWHVRMIDMIQNNTFFYEYLELWAPLYSCLAAALEFFVGNNFAALKVLSFLIGLVIPLAGVSLILVLRESLKDYQAIIAAVLTFVYPLLNTTTVMALRDTLLTFLALMSLIFVIWGLKSILSESWEKTYIVFLLAGGMLSLCVLTQYSYPLNVIYCTVVILVAIFTSYLRTKRLHWKEFLIYSTSGILVAVPWLIRSTVIYGTPLGPLEKRFLSPESTALSHWNNHFQIFYENLIVYADPGYLGWQFLIIVLLGISLLLVKNRLNGLLALFLLVNIFVTLFPTIPFESMQNRYWISGLILVPLLFSLALDFDLLGGVYIITTCWYVARSAVMMSNHWFILGSSSPPVPEFAHITFLQLTGFSLSVSAIFFVFIASITTLSTLYFAKNHSITRKTLGLINLVKVKEHQD